MEKSSTKSMNVFVLKTLIGMEIGAKIQVVLEDKHGMEMNVFAPQDSFSTERFAYNVLMGKYGMKKQKSVNVKLVIHGMETSVKKFIGAQVEEFTMRLFNNVSVKRDNFGMDLPV